LPLCLLGVLLACSICLLANLLASSFLAINRACHEARDDTKKDETLAKEETAEACTCNIATLRALNCRYYVQSFWTTAIPPSPGSARDFFARLQEGRKAPPPPSPCHPPSTWRDSHCTPLLLFPFPAVVGGISARIDSCWPRAPPHPPTNPARELPLAHPLGPASLHSTLGGPSMQLQRRAADAISEAAVGYATHTV
jgi:hypothetical protein